MSSGEYKGSHRNTSGDESVGHQSAAVSKELKKLFCFPGGLVEGG